MYINVHSSAPCKSKHWKQLKHHIIEPQLSKTRVATLMEYGTAMEIMSKLNRKVIN